MALTPDSIRQALAKCDGSRKEAAIKLKVSVDVLRIHIRRHRDRGEEFPTPQNERSRQAKCTANLQVGQWVETGRDQQCGEILAIEGGKSLIQFLEGGAEWLPSRQLAWVPSGDVIAERCREIQSRWTERDFGLRCWTERRKWFAPLVEAPGEPREEIW